MPVFDSVLVGVDLVHSGGSDSSSFSLPVKESIKHGLWLAEKASAKITFFAATDVAPEELHLLESDETHVGNSQLKAGLKALHELVNSAREQGINATSKAVSGSAWVEIIREVERHGHDLVIVGTRNVGTWQRLLFGSTAMHLLHDCPCPVWVTRPEPHPVPQNILITSDFSSVSDKTIKLGLAVGELSGAKVNLLHAVDFIVDRKYSVGLLYHKTEDYHAQVKAEALEKLTNQLTTVSGGQSAAEEVELHVVEGGEVADTAILQFIDQNQIDLLLIGTVARHGLTGVTVGNTAERLVSQVHCSMVAVKPMDFQCPISTAPLG